MLSCQAQQQVTIILSPPQKLTARCGPYGINALSTTYTIKKNEISNVTEIQVWYV